jgi:hypothetical protein
LDRRSLVKRSCDEQLTDNLENYFKA